MPKSGQLIIPFDNTVKALLSIIAIIGAAAFGMATYYFSDLKFEIKQVASAVSNMSDVQAGNISDIKSLKEDVRIIKETRFGLVTANAGR